MPIDLTVYSAQATLRAAYKITDRVFIVLHRDETDPNKMWAFFVARMATADVKPMVTYPYRLLALPAGKDVYVDLLGR